MLNVTNVTGPKAAPEPIDDGTADFYDVFVAALHLNPQTFRLIQGATPVEPNPIPLYNFFDSIPAATSVQEYTANPVNKFSGVYQYVLLSMRDGVTPANARDAYLNVNNWLGPAGKPPGNPGSNPIYSPSFQDIQTAVNSGSTISFTHKTVINQRSKNAMATDFWRDGPRVLQKGAIGGISILNNKAVSSTTVTQVTLNRYAMIAIQSGPWYNSAFFCSAYKNKNLWNDAPTAPSTWDAAFGPAGNVQSVATGALIVDGFSIITTNYGNYVGSDLATLQSAGDIRVWPCYIARGESAVKQDFSLNTDSSISSKITCSPGNYQFMGFNAESIDVLLGA